MNQPYISVLIPAYNVGPFITDTIESVIKQTFEDYEIIVVNDGSTDNTAEKLSLIQDSRLTILHITNQGVSHARNMAISHARGEYIAFLDADDIWEPQHLQRAADFLRAHPDIMWWTSQAYIATHPREHVQHPDIQTAVRNYYGLPSIYAHPSTLLLHTASARKLLPLFPENMTYAEDWAAWVSFAEKHPLIAFCPVRDVMYRYREGSATKNRPVSVLMEKMMGFPRHATNLLCHKKCSTLSMNYFRFRTTQRWLDFFAHLTIQGWENELQDQRKVLGTPLFFLIWFQTHLFVLMGRIICKTLSIVDSHLAKQIKETK